MSHGRKLDAMNISAVDHNGTYRANIFATCGPVPTQHESWGQLKARYRSAPGTPVTPGADIIR
jgi:hypothetical protein